MSSSTQGAGGEGAKAPPVGFFGRQARRNPATVAREANARRIEEEQNQQQQERNEAKCIADKERRRSRQEWTKEEADDTPEASDPNAKQYPHNLHWKKKRGFFWGPTDEELNEFVEKGDDRFAIEVQQSRARNRKRAFYWGLTDEELNEFVEKGDDKIAIDVHADRTGKDMRHMTYAELQIAAKGGDEIAQRTLEAKKLSVKLSQRDKYAKLRESARNGDQDAIAAMEYYKRKKQNCAQRQFEKREAERQLAKAGDVQALKAIELKRKKGREYYSVKKARRSAKREPQNTTVNTFCTSQSEVDEDAQMRRASTIDVDEETDEETDDETDEDDDSEDDPNEDLDILPGMILEEERQKKEQKGHDREEERAGEVDDDHSDELRKGSPSGNARLGSSKPSAATTVVNKEGLGQQGEDHGDEPRHNRAKGKEKE